MLTTKYLKLLLAFLLVGLMITAVSTTLMVQADDHETDDEDDEDEDREDREVEIDYDDNEIEIESERIGPDGVENEFSIEMDIDGKAEIEIEYSTEDNSTEVETEMKVVFISLIEYRDQNGNDVYDDETDEKIGSMELENYDPFGYTSTDLGNGETLHTISANTTDGVFGFIVHISESFTSVNGMDLKPTELKIDLLINDYPFEQNDTKLAFYHKIQSETEREFEDREESPGEEDETNYDDEEAIVDNREGAAAFYSWSKRAEVDGVNTTVEDSIREASSSEKYIYLNYERGTEIIHDPKLGISSITTSDTGIFTQRNIIIVSAIASVLFIAIALVIKRR